MPVRPLEAEDLALYRTIRLRALETNPEAFGSTHETERGFDDDTWRTRMLSFKENPGVIFIEQAEDADPKTGNPLAVTGIGLLDEPPATALIWGMWVAPEARGTGAARRLLRSAVGWAFERNIETVVLDVVRTNAAAIGLYESVGFVVIDDVVREDGDPCDGELRMHLTPATWRG